MTHWRMASFMASLRVAAPRGHGGDLRPQHPHAEDVRLLPPDVLGAHEDLAVHAEAAPPTVAVATPCWPAPVSAMSRFLPIRRAKRAWPRVLLILWAPVWLRSSRLR